jgi:cobalt-zinc-cadmium resistance protein CzcA
MMRYGLNVADVQSIIEATIGGKEVGRVFEGDRRFSLVVRLPENIRTDLNALKRIPVPVRRQDSNKLGEGRGVPNEQSTRGETLITFAPPFVPLGAVAKFNQTLGPNQISRENGKREWSATVRHPLLSSCRDHERFCASYRRPNRLKS